MITVVGSLNMDLFIEAARFPTPGETIPGKNFHRACGGKGANQAYAIAKMGGRVRMIGAAGRDAFGDEMLANLNEVGVNTSGVVRRADVPSGTAMITLDASGQNQIVVASGANDTLSAADVQRCQQEISESQALVVQFETSLESVGAALRIARESKTMTILNPAPFSPVDDDLLQLCDVIIPNENEASLLSGITVRDLKTAADASKALRMRAPSAEVLVTLGANGVWLDTRGFVGHVPGFAVTAVDTVGAGDTFIGAYVARLVERATPHEAAQFGCAAAAIGVTRRGAQSSIPNRAEVEACLAEHTRS